MDRDPSRWILYDKPDCPFCWKVRLALHETTQRFELKTFPDSQRPAEVLAINPKGTVPIVLHDRTVIGDSALAIEYIIDVVGSGTLMPSSPADRLRARTLHHYSTAVIGPAVREAIFELRDKPPEERDGSKIVRSRAEWSRCLDYLERELPDGAPCFVGDYSIAECALLPRFGLTAAYGFGVEADHPKLLRWYRAMKARPSFDATSPPRLRHLL
jgi:glutathione S-transferase